MDIEKLIGRWRNLANRWENGEQLLLDGTIRLQDELRTAATAISTLRAENEKLKAEVEHWKDAHNQAALNFQQENRECNKALAELEQVRQERDAAVSDLTYIARTYPVDLCDDLVCQYCKHYPNVNTGCPGWTENDCFEWRGPEEG